MKLPGIVALIVSGCSGDDARLEQRIVDKELPKLEAALASRSESGVMTACTMLSGAHMASDDAARYERHCWVDVPRLHFEIALADVKKHQREHPDMMSINCAQLFIPSALETLATHPASDPALVKLVADYKALCPTP